ncbi:MAG: PEP-CTERM sorting domain-containing protein [Planctomycetes bacterium]|nr:PEP-CTERM sorting domain-containing protein [Planctomycetota bacterium]
MRSIAHQISFYLATLLAAVFIAPERLQADILIDSYSANTNDRFTNNSAFIASAFNLSGIGQSESGRWATAISRNVVISANHLEPSGVIRFYSDNNPSTAPVTRTIVSGQKVGSTDLYVAVLDSALPSSIAHYSFANEILAAGSSSPFIGFNAGIYQDLNAYMVGRSPATNAPFQDQAIGRNRVSGYFENVNFLGNSDSDALIFLRDPGSTPQYVPFEAYLQPGDSGAPLFVDINGEFRLLGTNAFINSPNTSPEFSGINYIGNQASAINAYIVAVPEPSSTLLVALGGMGVMILRRRINSSKTPTIS